MVNFNLELVSFSRAIRRSRYFCVSLSDLPGMVMQCAETWKHLEIDKLGVQVYIRMFQMDPNMRQLFSFKGEDRTWFSASSMTWL